MRPRRQRLGEPAGRLGRVAADVAAERVEVAAHVAAPARAVGERDQAVELGRRRAPESIACRAADDARASSVVRHAARRPGRRRRSAAPCRGAARSRRRAPCGACAALCGGVAAAAGRRAPWPGPEGSRGSTLAQRRPRRRAPRPPGSRRPGSARPARRRRGTTRRGRCRAAASTCAIGSTSSVGVDARSPGRGAPAGLVSGPSRLNTVRTPSSRRTGAAWRMAGWCAWANMKPKPTSSMQSATSAGVRSMRTPSASSTSAVPARDDIARLPCLATMTPAAAATSAPAVEMLKVCGAVAAGAARCPPASRRRGSRRHVGAHRAGAAGDLLGRLALHPQRRPGSRRSGPAWPGRSMTCIIAACASSAERSSCPRSAAAIASVIMPSAPGPGSSRSAAARRGVSTDSGWNWTPCTASSWWRTPITSPSRGVGGDRQRPGTSSAASEW